ncbi:MAG: hypothetical protein ABR505_08215 [Actinomycetota bacterium]
MNPHEIWHVFVLGAALTGAAVAALLFLIPLAFDPPPQGFARLRPLMRGIVLLVAALLVLEWIAIH